MAHAYLCFAGALISILISFGNAQTSTYVETNVPMGTPVPGNYAGPLRPQVHFSPPVGFMNDPNGMFVDADGVYHLYYQYNPTATVAGNQHWGHATSRDLYTWINQPIALFPSSPNEGIFSGSVVIDSNNTSGFFPNQTNGVVAIYTLNVPERETQDIAYSYDGGYSFIKYTNNPVLDINSTQFRDPKVFWYVPTERWIMVVAYAQDLVIGIFSSSNLKEWTHESNFTRQGLTGLQYECPNLVAMPIEGGGEAWVLFISINPGAPLGGSATEYFPGSFNGKQFVPFEPTTNFLDFGKDNYAAQFFYNIPLNQKQVSVGWASNWQYTNNVPTDGEGWRSVMTVAREHSLKNMSRVGLSLISYPHNISAAIELQLAYNASLGNGILSLDYASAKSKAIYFEANVTGLTLSTLSGTLSFEFTSSASGEKISGGTSIETGDLWFDRGKAGWSNNFFTDKFSVTGLYDGAGAWRLSGVVDRSVIEIFLNRGEHVGTSVFFPTQPFDRLTLSIDGVSMKATTSVGVWTLRAAWLDQADSSGNVIGNVTHS